MLVDQFQFVDSCLKEEISWKETAKKFNQEYKLGINSEALRKRYQREVARIETLGNDSVEKAFRVIKQNPQKPADLAKRFNLDIDSLQDLMDDLLNNRAAIKFHQGYLVFDRLAPAPDNIKHNISLLSSKEGWVKFGLYADPHFCSVHEQIQLLHNFYKICEQEKVAAMLCAGDFTAGNGTVYKGQYQDLKIIGADKQVEYVQSVWPDTNLDTYVIGGNHDSDLYKTAGVDIVDIIASKIDNLHYLGKMSAVIESEGVSFFLRHGEGGLGAFRSYKAQKIIDSLSKDEICDVSIIGHWHCNLYMPNYKGTIVIMPGCFEAQSDYMIRKSLVPEIGGVILELKLAEINGEKKIVRHKVDFLDMGVLKGI